MTTRSICFLYARAALAPPAFAGFGRPQLADHAAQQKRGHTTGKRRHRAEVLHDDGQQKRAARAADAAAGTQKPTPDPRSSVENSSGGYTNSNTEAAEIIKLKVEMQISAQRVGIPCQTVMVSRLRRRGKNSRSGKGGAISCR